MEGEGGCEAYKVKPSRAQNAWGPRTECPMKRLSLVLLAAMVTYGSLTFHGVNCGGAKAAPARRRPRLTRRQRRKALRLLKSGISQLKKKRYQAALWDLQKGFKIYRHFAFPLFMGRCHFHLDRPRKALALFKMAKKIGKLTPRHKKLLVKYRKEAKKRLGFDKVLIVTVPANGVKIWIDGDIKGTTPLTEALMVSKGAHKIEAVKNGFLATERSVDIKGGGVVSLKIELDKDTSPSRATGRHGDAGDSGSKTSGAGSGAAHSRKGGDSSNGKRTDGKGHASNGTDPGHGGSQNGDTSGPGSRTKNSKKKGGLGVYEWVSLGIAAAGVVALIPGGIYLSMDGKKASQDPATGYSARRYDTKQLGIGFAVSGGVLLVGAAVCYGLSWLFSDRNGKGEEKATSAQPKSISIRIDPATGTPVVGAGFEF